MSTVVLPTDGTWQQVLAGPITKASISAHSRKYYMLMVPGMPAPLETGHPLQPDASATIELTGADNLWVRVVNGGDSTIAITI